MNRITRKKRAAAALAIAIWGAAIACAQSATGMLAAVDRQKRFAGVDCSYELEMVTSGGGKADKRARMRIFRRDAEALLVALVLEPSGEKGEGYLRRGDNLWFFDAESGAFVHRVLTDSVSGSEMQSGDFEPDSLAESYSIAGTERGRLGAIEAEILELEERGVQIYPRMRVWVRASDGLLLKEEYFGASGRLLRYVLYPAHLRIGGRTMPSKIVYVDALEPDRRTVATIGSPSLERIDDSVFAKAFLERAR